MKVGHSNVAMLVATYQCVMLSRPGASKLQAILYHSLVCVHAHNLGGSGVQNVHPLKHIFIEILYQNTVQSERKKPFK